MGWAEACWAHQGRGLSSWVAGADPWGQVTCYLVGQAALDGREDSGGRGAVGQPSHSGRAAAILEVRPRAHLRSGPGTAPCGREPLWVALAAWAGPVVKTPVPVSAGGAVGSWLGPPEGLEHGLRAQPQGLLQCAQAALGVEVPSHPGTAPGEGRPNTAVRGASAPTLHFRGVACCAEPPCSVPT